MASKKKMSTTDICVVCLEPLLGISASDNDDDGHEDDDNNKNERMADFGAAVSCGHPAHFSCFNQWASYQKSGNSDKGVPCPTCQQPTSSFVKIYMRAQEQEEEEDDGDDDSASDDEGCAEEEAREDGSLLSTNTSQHTMKTSAANMSQSASKRSTAPPTTTKHKSTTKKKQQQAVHKKVQWYKKRWMGKCQQVKTLQLEAQNRKKSHHEDLEDLERSQSMNFRLSKELERTVHKARLHCNVAAATFFMVGWFTCRKFYG